MERRTMPKGNMKKLTMLWLVALVCPCLTQGQETYTLDRSSVRLSLQSSGLSFTFLSSNSTTKLVMEFYRDMERIYERRCMMDNMIEWQTVVVKMKGQQLIFRSFHKCYYVVVPDKVTHINLHKDGPGKISVKVPHTAVQTKVDSVASTRRWCQVALITVLCACLGLSFCAACLVCSMMRADRNDLKTRVDVEDPKLMIIDIQKTDDKQMLVGLN